MTLCDVHDGIHFTADTRIMNRHDGTGSGGDCCFNQVLIDVHGIRADIHKHHLCTAQYKCIGCGYEGIGRHDHLIAFFDSCKKCRQLCRMCAGSGQKALADAGLLLNPFIVLCCKFTVSADLLILHADPDIIHFLTCIRWNIKIDSHTLSSMCTNALIYSCDAVAVSSSFFSRNFFLEMKL